MFSGGSAGCPGGRSAMLRKADGAPRRTLSRAAAIAARDRGRARNIAARLWFSPMRIATQRRAARRCFVVREPLCCTQARGASWQSWQGATIAKLTAFLWARNTGLRPSWYTMASLMRMNAMDLRQQPIAMKRRTHTPIRQWVARSLHNAQTSSAEHEQCATRAKGIWTTSSDTAIQSRRLREATRSRDGVTI